MCDVSGAEAVAAGFAFYPATAELIHTGPGGSGSAVNYVAIPCWLNSPDTTTLTLTSGTGLTLERGLHTLTVTPATLTAKFSGLPATIKPGETVQGTLTCTNAGPGPNALNVTCNPAIASGGASITNLLCTTPTKPVPAPPAASLPEAALHDGEEIVCTFGLTAPNTPTVNIELTGTTTADGLFASTATRSPGGMTSTIWLRSATSTAVPALNPATLAALALALLGLAAFARKRQV